MATAVVVSITQISEMLSLLHKHITGTQDDTKDSDDTKTTYTTGYSIALIILLAIIAIYEVFFIFCIYKATDSLIYTVIYTITVLATIFGSNTYYIQDIAKSILVIVALVGLSLI